MKPDKNKVVITKFWLKNPKAFLKHGDKSRSGVVRRGMKYEPTFR